MQAYRARDEFRLGKRQHQHQAQPTRLARLEEQQVASIGSLGQGEIARPGAELIQRGGDGARGNAFLFGWKARLGTVGSIDHVATEKKDQTWQHLQGNMGRLDSGCCKRGRLPLHGLLACAGFHWRTHKYG